MPELTFHKQKNGLYTAEYINGQWISFYDVTEEDKNKKDIELLYNKYKVYSS